MSLLYLQKGSSYCPPFCFFLFKHTHCKKHYRGNGQIDHNPLKCKIIIICAPQLINSGRNGSGSSGNISGNHAGCAILSKRTGKSQYSTGKNTLSAGGHPDSPENEGIAKSQSLTGIGKSLVKALKCTAGYAVHKGKGHNGGSKNAAVPGHDQLDSKNAQKPDANRVVGTKQKNEKITDNS